jgi:excinuclease ABC subunit A
VKISIRGARTHNLQAVDLDIPHQALTVVTGVSGSGKSSLVFDTLFAEAQRQYLESLSTYARQYIDQMPRPDIDSMEGLQPTVCIDQQFQAANPRSTVATITEVHDYLRLLMARCGTPLCPHCGRSIVQQSPDRMVDQIARLPMGTRVILMAPMVRGRKGTHRSILEEIRKAGLVRVRVDGQTLDLDSVPELSRGRNHSIDAVVDRIILREDVRSRVDQAVQLSIRLAKGLVLVRHLPPGAGTAPPAEEEGWLESIYSTQFACPDCGTSLGEIEPRTFSFNSPYGACPVCQGTGRDPQGAPCSECRGTRLGREARSVRLMGTAANDGVGKSIDELVALPIRDALDWFRRLALDEARNDIAAPLLREIRHRLQFLVQVGVGYLSLDRSADTLSGGELQRVRLATCIGSGLVGVCYVLDEPSIGLHPRDNDQLIQSLRDLQTRGNTVVVVEHDGAMMLAADRLVDMGPGAGPQGGRVIAEGSPAQVLQHSTSLTASYLRGEIPIRMRTEPRSIDHGRCLRIEGASHHNLKDVDVSLPLKCLIGISGVSGSGKSTLVHDTLVPAIFNAKDGSRHSVGKHRGIQGLEQIDKLIAIDQAPIGRSPRSTPATYAGIFDEIRKVYAQTRDAKQRGFTASRFSFNTGEGRCESCQGQGQQKLEMSFLSDLYVTCPRCHGDRFNRQTLQIRYKGCHIAQALAMSIDEAAGFFENFSKIARVLQCMRQVGLGYLSLGQPSTTLSGGEAQRVKLATHLAKNVSGSSLYVLDEPTTGLHFEDVRRLLSVLQALVDQGHTVLVIEHHIDVLANCDWLIDLGPEGGDSGGEVVALGTPASVAQSKGSYTGEYLRRAGVGGE